VVCQSLELVFGETGHGGVDTAHELLPRATTTPELVEIPEGILYSEAALKDKLLDCVDYRRNVILLRFFSFWNWEA
jgi:hypothetical protein